MVRLGEQVCCTGGGKACFQSRRVGCRNCSSCCLEICRKAPVRGSVVHTDACPDWIFLLFVHL